jgi:IS5 family transposase
VVKRQRTILGIVIRDVRRRLLVTAAAGNASALASLSMWLERAERIRSQQRHDKNKLYALHAPEVGCIAKGKARKPYEFGVKVSVAITHKQGLVVGARSFPGNPWDGHTLAEQIEQSTILLEEHWGQTQAEVVVDLGYRGKEVDAGNPGVEIVHRGRYKTMAKHERKVLKRRQAVEPAIGHLKANYRMNRCWLAGATGDALHVLCCAVGYNLRWPMRAVVRLGLRGLLLCLSWLAYVARLAVKKPTPVWVC